MCRTTPPPLRTHRSTDRRQWYYIIVLYIIRICWVWHFFADKIYNIPILLIVVLFDFTLLNYYIGIAIILFGDELNRCRFYLFLNAVKFQLRIGFSTELVLDIFEQTQNTQVEFIFNHIMIILTATIAAINIVHLNINDNFSDSTITPLTPIIINIQRLYG